MEFADGSPGVQIVPGNPLVVRVIVTFPFDEVLDVTIADARVEYLIQFEVFGIIHDDGVWGWGLAMTREGVQWHLEEFDDWKDWVKVLQRWGKFQLICSFPDCGDHPEGAKAKGVELLAGSICMDV